MRLETALDLENKNEQATEEDHTHLLGILSPVDNGYWLTSFNQYDCAYNNKMIQKELPFLKIWREQHQSWMHQGTRDLYVVCKDSNVERPSINMMRGGGASV